MILKNRQTKKLELVMRWNQTNESYHFIRNTFNDETITEVGNGDLVVGDRIIHYGDVVSSDSKLIIKDIKPYFKSAVTLKNHKDSSTLFPLPSKIREWLDFQHCALSHSVWKFKYLFHWPGRKKPKPWQLRYGLLYGWDKMDVEELVLDWESKSLNDNNPDAYEKLNEIVESEQWKNEREILEKLIRPVIYKLGL